MQETRCGVLPLCRDAVGVFYCPSRLSCTSPDQIGPESNGNKGVLQILQIPRMGTLSIRCSWISYSSNQSSKSFSQGLCAARSWGKSCNPLYHTNCKEWRRLLCWEEGGLSSWKGGDLHWVKGKLNQTGYHSILQHNAILSGTRLVAKGFVLLQDNDPKRTSKLYQRWIKSKEEQHILQLMPVQSADLNPIELVWDELFKAKQPTSAAHPWQLQQESWAELTSVYLLVVRMLRICEAVRTAKWGHFDELKVLEAFCVFWFDLYLMWPLKACI